MSEETFTLTKDELQKIIFVNLQAKGKTKKSDPIYEYMVEVDTMLMNKMIPGYSEILKQIDYKE